LLVSGIAAPMLYAVGRVRFAGLYPRKDHFIAGFALHRRLTNRI
jgi:hypothetical protein